MAGNGINVIRIAPYSAVQFSTYEFFKSAFVSHSSDHAIDTPRRLCAGALAGICAVVSTYPLDLVRSRLSVESASLGMKEGRVDGRSTGIWRMTVRVYRDEGGVRALYRGLVPTSCGVAPYVGCSFVSGHRLESTERRTREVELITPSLVRHDRRRTNFSRSSTSSTSETNLTLPSNSLVGPSREGSRKQ